ncbi:MAG TPA: ferrochelatase, partial [Asanoa sp.]|nr:ferrochelatase [Asanoa sp.]
FVEPAADGVRAALAGRPDARLVFTAHSIPTGMAVTAGPPPVTPPGRYVAQLRESAALVAAAAAPDLPWDLVWQSRSGPPQVPWLEPDVNDHLAALADTGVTGVVVSPIGFVSDHLEVIWDLDNEAAATAKSRNLDFVRAATPGTDPRFVAMVRELVLERVEGADTRPRLGSLPLWDTCPADCCTPPARRPS